jgi:D-xylose reductase
MENLVDHNLTKNIGVRYVPLRSGEVKRLTGTVELCSNFAGGLILDLLRYARIKPAVLQVEIHPYLTQDALVQLARNLGIAVIAYSSFGPQSYIELEMHKGAETLFNHDTVLKIANDHKKSM